MAEATHQVQVVGDEQDRHARFALQLVEQRQDLRLDRHVERGGRLVGDQQLRPAGERHRDHRALALPARQLVRKRVDAALRIGNAGAREQLDGARVRLLLAEALVQLEHLGDLVADRVAAG